MEEDAFRLMNTRLDLAWKWYEFHAKQRMTMFNFFILITGVLAAGLTASLKEGQWPISAAIAGIGVLASISSFFFDVRNRKMVEYAADIMETIEAQLYPPDLKSPDGRRLGCILNERENKMREGESLKARGFWRQLQKHKTWIYGFQLAIGMSFGCSFLLIGRQGPTAVVALESELARVDALRTSLVSGVAAQRTVDDLKSIDVDLARLRGDVKLLAERVGALQTVLVAPSIQSPVSNTPPLSARP